MAYRWSWFTAFAALAVSQSAAAEPPGHAAQLATTALAVPGERVLTVSSPSFAAGGVIPLEDTQYGANRFPGLTWTPGPAGTHSYAVLVQGAPEGGAWGAGATNLHLTLYDIPADVTRLQAGMTTPPSSASYGETVHGLHSPYAGPHAHTAAPTAYHFQVLALDIAHGASPDLDYAGLVAAINGHVLAAGDLVGFAAKPRATASVAGLAPVRIDTGLVQGAVGRDPAIVVYKDIPYAAPPVDALRFRPPAPPEAWTGVRQASAAGPVCPQPASKMIPAGTPMSEDCLTLNVWTLERPGATAQLGGKHAVYVWIYGGGFIGGAGSDPEFDGEGLARKGVVVVTFNYRLGALGFLSTPALSRESGHGSSGDYGLLDDIAALKWVRRNISAFGGDPDKVTIGGQSAGAGSVGFLAISPLARGLFRTAIAESHARYPRDPELRYLSVSYRRLPEAEAAGEAYAKAHGAATPEALRALSWQTLIQGSDTIDPHVETGSDGKPPLFRPVVDGWVIPTGYVNAYANGTQNPVTFVAGNNKDETGAVPETAFATLRAAHTRPRAGMPQTNVTLSAYVSSAKRKFGALTDEFLQLYPAHDDQEAAEQNDAAARDDSRMSTYLWGTLWSVHGTRPVFTYFWTHAPPGPQHDMRGAYHGSEINYAFDNLYATNRPWTAEDRRIAGIVSAYWSNIIRTGDPNAAGLPMWPRYDPKVAQVMEIGDHFGPIPVASPEKIAFWKQFYSTQAAW